MPHTVWDSAASIDSGYIHYDTQRRVVVAPNVILQLDSQLAFDHVIETPSSYSTIQCLHNGKVYFECSSSLCEFSLDPPHVLRQSQYRLQEVWPVTGLVDDSVHIESGRAYDVSSDVLYVRSNDIVLAEISNFINGREVSGQFPLWTP